MARGGDLLVGVPGGRVVREHAPVAYQVAGGRRLPVRSRYVLTRGGDVRIAVGAYDPARQLVIDPTVTYGTYVGGIRQDQGISIAADADGDAYVAGNTLSTDLVGAGAGAQPAPGGGQDVFVTKLNATGTAALYSTYLGGSGTDQALGMAIDASGDAMVTGWTASTNFPVTAGAAQAVYGGGTSDVFAAKLNPSGTAFVYSTYLGGTGSPNGSLEQANGIASDAAGNAYLTGLGYGGYPTTPGSFDPAQINPSTANAFVTKLSPDGTLAYSTYLHGAGGAFSIGNAIAVDATGSAYVTGWQTATFPTTPGAYQTANRGSADMFVTKLSPAGSALTYSTLLGGVGFDQPTAITIDGDGRAYVAGSGSSPWPVTPDAIRATRPAPPASCRCSTRRGRRCRTRRSSVARRRAATRRRAWPSTQPATCTSPASRGRPTCRRPPTLCAPAAPARRTGS